MKRLWIVAAVCATAAALTSFAAQGGAVAPADLLKQPAVKAAIDIVRTIEPQTIEDQVRFCEIPAPPFKERARGEALREAFQQAGLRNVRFDRAGNVLGDRPGTTARPHVVLAAHQDTVFPEETDVKVRRNGAIFPAPGLATIAAVWPSWSP